MIAVAEQPTKARKAEAAQPVAQSTMAQLATEFETERVALIEQIGLGRAEPTARIAELRQRVQKLHAEAAQNSTPAHAAQCMQQASNLIADIDRAKKVLEGVEQEMQAAAAGHHPTLIALSSTMSIRTESAERDRLKQAHVTIRRLLSDECIAAAVEVVALSRQFRVHAGPVAEAIAKLSEE